MTGKILACAGEFCSDRRSGSAASIELFRMEMRKIVVVEVDCQVVRVEGNERRYERIM